MAEIYVEPFRPGQEMLVAQIHNASFDEWARKLGEAYAYRKVMPQEVLDWSQKPSNTIWLAYLNGVPAGYIHCRVEEIRGRRKFLHLLYELTDRDMGQSKIAVVPRYRGRGVGKALLRTTLEYFKDRGVEIATAYAYDDNESASALLSSLGFRHEEIFYYEDYSQQEPFAFDSIYAELDLSKPLKDVRLNPDVKVRTPREEDLDALIRIFGECSPWVYGPKPSAKEVLSWLHNSRAKVTLVAEYRGETVGAMEFFKDGRIGIPGVLPEHRRKGIGTTLFYHLLKEMQRHGLVKAVVDTGIILRDAIRMYHRLGFHIARRRWAWIKLM